jgi:hypothetical protein
VGVAVDTSLAIDPLDQILARFSLVISNSMTFLLGFNGASGGVIFFPLIASWTDLARERE